MRGGKERSKRYTLCKKTHVAPRVNFIYLILTQLNATMSRLDKYKFVPCGVARTQRGCNKAMITLKQENHRGAGRDSKN